MQHKTWAYCHTSSSRRVSFYSSVGLSQPVKMSLLFGSKSIYVPLEIRFGAEMTRTKRTLEHRFLWFFHAESPRQRLEPVHLSIVQEQRLTHYLQPWTRGTRRFFQKTLSQSEKCSLWTLFFEPERRRRQSESEEERWGERKENLLPRSSDGKVLSSTI